MEKNDKLKQFVEDHQDEFNDVQLPEGHFDRFEQKLPRQGKKSVRIIRFIALAAAACVGLVLLFNLSVNVVERVDSGTPLVCELGQEVDELQIYYQMQMTAVLDKMETLYEQDRSAGTAELLQETKHVQLSSLQAGEALLPTLPCNENAITVITQHYGTSLESMQYMLQQMKRITEINHH